MKGMCTEKNITLSQLGAEKIAFLIKLDKRTDGRTALLLKISDKSLTLVSLLHKNLLLKYFGLCHTPLILLSVVTGTGQ